MGFSYLGYNPESRRKDHDVSPVPHPHGTGGVPSFADPQGPRPDRPPSLVSGGTGTEAEAPVSGVVPELGGSEWYPGNRSGRTGTRNPGVKNLFEYVTSPCVDVGVDEVFDFTFPTTLSVTSRGPSPALLRPTLPPTLFRSLSGVLPPSPSFSQTCPYRVTRDPVDRTRLPTAPSGPIGPRGSFRLSRTGPVVVADTHTDFVPSRPS